MLKLEKNPLNTYRWRGINEQNERLAGEIQASHLIMAKTELLSQGITRLRLQKKRNFNFTRRIPIKSAEIAVFLRQLTTLLQAGIPLLQACEIIRKAQTNKAFCQLVSQIQHTIETGASFAEALGQHPHLFPPLLCALVRVGEQSGSLDILLNQIAQHQEKMQQLQKKLKKAATYPSFILVFAVLITAILLTVVIPSLQHLFLDLGAELPPITQHLIQLSLFLQNTWLPLLGLGTASLCALTWGVKHSETLSYQKDRLFLSLPLIGLLVKNNCLARFTRTLAITYAAGLPLLKALHLVAKSTGSRVFMRAIHRLQQEISSGHSLQEALSREPLFPDRVRQMVAVGEDSGKLEWMLDKIADFYEAEVDNRIEMLSSLLEPVIMVILGGLIAGLLIAMYLPIFKLGSAL